MSPGILCRHFSFSFLLWSESSCCTVRESALMPILDLNVDVNVFIGSLFMSMMCPFADSACILFLVNNGNCQGWIYVHGMSMVSIHLLSVWIQVLMYLKREGVHIALLQETHLNHQEHLKLQQEGFGKIFSSSFMSRSRGVDILQGRNCFYICLLASW